MSVFSPRKSSKNRSDTSPDHTRNSPAPADPAEASQSVMDVDDPPVDPLLALDHTGSHPGSNTAEMEAAWTNCSRRARVEDVSDDNDNDSDSDGSESMDLDSDINLFSDDEDEDNENDGAHRHDFGDLGLGFQLRAAQAGMTQTCTRVRANKLKRTHQPDR